MISPGLLEISASMHSRFSPNLAEFFACVPPALQKPWWSDFKNGDFALPEHQITWINHWNSLFIYYVEIIIPMRGDTATMLDGAVEIEQCVYQRSWNVWICIGTNGIFSIIFWTFRSLLGKTLPPRRRWHHLWTAPRYLFYLNQVNIMYVGKFLLCTFKKNFVKYTFINGVL